MLDAKKAHFEQMIQALELEDVVAEGVQEEGKEEEEDAGENEDSAADDEEVFSASGFEDFLCFFS